MGRNTGERSGERGWGTLDTLSSINAHIFDSVSNAAHDPTLVEKGVKCLAQAGSKPAQIRALSLLLAQVPLELYKLQVWINWRPGR